MAGFDSLRVPSLVAATLALLVVGQIPGRGEAVRAECRVRLAAVGQALVQHHRDRGRAPERLEELVPRYLTLVPRCPEAGEVRVEYAHQGREFTLRCGSPHRGRPPVVVRSDVVP